MPLDYEGRQLLEHYRLFEDPQSLEDIEDTTAADPGNRIKLTLDAARRVRHFTVLDIEMVRSPGALLEAVSAAYTAADAARGVTSLERSGGLGRWMSEAASIMDGTRRPRSGTPPDVSRDAALASEETTSELPAKGVSSNGYLTVFRSSDGDIVGLEVDEAWLRGARPHFLGQALQQAFERALLATTAMVTR